MGLSDLTIKKTFYFQGFLSPLHFHKTLYQNFSIYDLGGAQNSITTNKKSSIFLNLKK